MAAKEASPSSKLHRTRLPVLVLLPTLAMVTMLVSTSSSRGQHLHIPDVGPFTDLSDLTLARLVAAPGNSSSSATDAKLPLFYLCTMAEVESQDPWLAECGLSAWAALIYQHLEMSARRTLDPREASILVFPTYATWEENWPIYGLYFNGLNVNRQGSRCVATEERFFQAALAARQRLVDRIQGQADNGGLSRPAPRILIVDSFPFYPSEPPLLAYYTDDRLAWAKLNALAHIHRPGVDVSLPPPAHDTLQLLPHQLFSDLAAQRSPKEAKPKYLLTFKGNFGTHPAVRGALGRLHDPGSGIIVLDTQDEEAAKAYDYADLVTNTLFTAVPRGHVEFSYRLSEILCSGAVPVLIADSWVPPLNGSVPFHTYGLHVPEADVNLSLVQRLRAIPPHVHANMRANALTVCHRKVASPYSIVDAVMAEALAHAVAA